MKRIWKYGIFLLLIIVLLSGCSETTQLKTKFVAQFKIGCALNNGQISGSEAESIALITSHFNTITPENILKWSLVHPQPEEYSFGPPDSFVSLGEKNNMFIVGHTLVWHQQVPDWVFKNDKGGPVNNEVLVKRMREHIHTVVGRYRGRISAWDVVNEAVEPTAPCARHRGSTLSGRNICRLHSSLHGKPTRMRNCTITIMA